MYLIRYVLHVVGLLVVSILAAFGVLCFIALLLGLALGGLVVCVLGACAVPFLAIFTAVKTK